MCERRPACHQMFVALLANKKQQQVMAKEFTYITGNALKKFLLKKGFGLVTSLPSFPGPYRQQIVVLKLSAMVIVVRLRNFLPSTESFSTLPY